MAVDDERVPKRSYRGKRVYPDASFSSFEMMLNKSEKSENVWHRYLKTQLIAIARVLCESSLILKFLVVWNWMGSYHRTIPDDAIDNRSKS